MRNLTTVTFHELSFGDSSGFSKNQCQRTVVYADWDLCLFFSHSRFLSAREGEQNNTQLAVKFTPLFDLHRTIFWDENKTDQSEAFAAGKTPGTVICKRTLDWTEDYLICEASFHWLGNVGQAKINALPRSHQSVGLKRDRAQTDTVWEEKQRVSEFFMCIFTHTGSRRM